MLENGVDAHSRGGRHELQGSSAASAAAPWRGGGAPGLELSIEYQVPVAAKTGVAVYTSWSIGLTVGGQFVWYETALFDLDRPLGGDEIWMDTISHRPIVHAVLSHTAPSLFHRVFPDSAVSDTAPWTGWRRFHFAIEEEHVRAAVLATNAKFNTTLSDDAADWRLVHTNVEVEGTAGGTAAHALRAMVISTL